MTNLGKEVKRIRELKGLSQEAVAKKLNVSSQYFSNIERGSTGMSPVKLKTFAKVFKINPAFLVNLVVADYEERFLRKMGK